MLNQYQFLYRKLLLALLSILLLAPTHKAIAADFSAGILNVGGVVAIWFQSNVGSSMAIASYKINGGAQQNVLMTKKDNGRFELPISANAGESVSIRFTYSVAGGTERFVDFSPYTVPPGGDSAGKVLGPIFEPPAGNYNSTQNVTVKSGTPGASVACSIDGGPYKACSGSLTVAATTTIVASATKTGMINSDASRAIYTIGSSGGGATHGVIDSGSSLTLWMNPNTASTNAIAHYRLNTAGQENVYMRSVGGRYELVIPVISGAAVSLKFSFDYMNGSGQTAVDGSIWTRAGNATVSAPMISPLAGAITASQAITISGSSGSTVYYSTDGRDPTVFGTLYSTPFTLTAPGATVKAVSKLNGAISTVSSAAYTLISSTLAAPVITPQGGAIRATDAIAITASPGAQIYYSTNGANPAEGTLYTGPFTLAADATVKAFARKSGSTDSTIASAVFTLTSIAPRYGVKEEAGRAARVWIELPASAGLAEAHIRTGNRNIDEKMVYNVEWKRWESLAFSTAPGMEITYFFVHRLGSSGGNSQSPAYRYTVCASGSTAAGCPGSVSKPVFSPPGGTYTAGQKVTLSAAPEAPAGTKLFYTLDGSPASPSAVLYAPGQVLTISQTSILSAIAVHPNGEIARDAQSYVIQASCASLSAGCVIEAPTFSHPSASYPTEIRLNIMTSTIGARVHYTLDGSVPTAASPQFREAFSMLDLRDQSKGNQYKVIAVAIKDGVSSVTTERNYTITSNSRTPWSGLTQFKLENKSGLPASEVYWFLIGKRWLPDGVPDQFVRVGRNGELIDITLSDNTITFVDPRGGISQLADYNFRLDEVPQVNNVPAIRSARIYMSVKKPVLVQVKKDDKSGLISYAGPNLQNWADPNIETRFEFAEFNINEKDHPFVPGIFINTSRVDMFSFPVQLKVTGEDGYSATVGESMDIGANEMFAAFVAQTPDEFRGLYEVEDGNKNVKRIVAPAHGDFHGEEKDTEGNVQREAGANEHYLDAYIDEVWNQYRNEPLTILLGDNAVPLTGRVGHDDIMSFSDGLGIYKINGKPTTDEVLLGKGLLDDSRGLVKGTPEYHKQLQLQAQLCAALNRHVAHLPYGQWHNSTGFYAAGTAANWFAAFFHRYSINAMAYGFAYDDVGHQSPSIYTPQPKEVTYSIGKIEWK